MKTIYNYLSFDIEEWFHITGNTSAKSLDLWDNYEETVVKNTTTILDILDEYETKATFFILGWVAEKYPLLAKEISDRGHELGTHGYDHSLVFNQSPSDFEKSLKKSIKIIENCTSKDVVGFRAPSFSITKDSEWAYSVVKKVGLKFDSSLFQALRADGGYGNVSSIKCKPYLIDTPHGPLVEVPLSVSKFLNFNIPMCGGGYLRAYPFFFIKWAFDRDYNAGRPMNYYLHPRDIDPNQPRLEMSFWKQLKSYNNLKGTKNKFIKLLKRYKFKPILKGLIENSKIK